MMQKLWIALIVYGSALLMAGIGMGIIAAWAQQPNQGRWAATACIVGFTGVVGIFVGVSGHER